MNDKTKTGLEILEAAILLGVLGDILLRQTPWGLNVFLWVGVLVAAMIVLVLRRKKELWSAQTMALHGALIFFAAMFVWRDSIELKIYDTLAILAILGILTLPALKIKTQVAGVFQYIIAGCWAGIYSACSPFLLVFDDIEWKTLPQNGWTKNISAVLRGLAIAAPILFIFGALFMAADAVFQGIIEQTFHINPDTLLIHTIVIVMLSWITAGYLRGTLMEVFSKTPPAQTPAVQPQRLSISKIEDDETKPNQNAQNTPNDKCSTASC